MLLQNPQLFRQQAFIDGNWCDANNKKTLDVTNPATGENIGTVPDMTDTETNSAIDAANQALIHWRATTVKQRAILLRRWYELIVANQDDLAKIMTMEQGKPLSEAKGEILYAASFIEWFAEEAKRIYGDTITGYPADRRVSVIRQPVGVTAIITPWNFPAAMITRKAGAALAAGCTIVIKPASQTPYSALALAELAHQAGIGHGVINVVTGSPKKIAAAMTGNPLVRKISFTGSTEVGAQLMSASAHDIKKLSLELGGNAPFIVFDDADIDAAVAGAVASKFRNSGQTCICTNRFYIHDKIYDQFVDKFTAAVSQLRVGNGLEDNVDIGPLINQAAVDKVKDHIADAVAKGATLLHGGKVLNGTFFTPTILTNVPGDAKIAHEETFGPLAPLFRFTSEEEVIQQANNTEFGLAAYFYTSEINRLYRVSEALEYGMVGVNTGLMSAEFLPFGGVKSSGIGREGSKYGIEDYLEIKCVCVGNVK